MYKVIHVSGLVTVIKADSRQSAIEHAKELGIRILNIALV